MTVHKMVVCVIFLNTSNAKNKVIDHSGDHLGYKKVKIVEDCLILQILHQILVNINSFTKA